MSEMENAERNLAASLGKLTQAQAVELVCGAMTIAFGDSGLRALCAEGTRHLGDEEGLEQGLR